MSKHYPNRHPKRDSDLYPTPMVSVLPLIPHLRTAKVKTFCEPCSGDGDLVRHFEAHGLQCLYQGDIRTGQDALSVESFPAPVITNPPFSNKNRKLLLALIRHFMETAPFVWLLLPVDRINTKYMQPYMPYCSHVVIAGRDQWLQNGGTGTQDLGRFRFDRNHASGPIVHNGTALLGVKTVSCQACGAAFQPTRSDAVFCSQGCKQSVYRKRIIHNAAVTPSTRLVPSRPRPSSSASQSDFQPHQPSKGT